MIHETMCVLEVWILWVLIRIIFEDVEDDEVVLFISFIVFIWEIINSDFHQIMRLSSNKHKSGINVNHTFKTFLS